MPESVTITLVMDLKPEAVTPFCDSIKVMIRDTAERPGFKNIRILKNKDDPNQVILIEEWASEDDYHAYIAWRTARGEMDMMTQILAGPPKMSIWPVLVASA